MVSPSAPLPLAWGQIAPPLALQLQVKPVRPGGIASLTTEPPAARSPTLSTCTVYPTVPPGTAAPVPAVFTICSTGTDGSIALSVQGGALLAGAHNEPAGGSSVATFVICAGGAAANVAVIE